MAKPNGIILKICSKCGKRKSLDSFPGDKSRKDGKYPQCKVCHNKKNTKYRGSNPDYHSNYYEKNSRIIKDRSFRWRTDNPERARENVKRWFQKNRGRRNYLGAKYRAKKLKATPNWLTEDQHNEIRMYYQFSKSISGVVGKNYHVDHIVPLQGKNVCGLHVPWNLQVIPSTENLRKGNKYGKAEGDSFN